jgi:antitoxin HicB
MASKVTKKSRKPHHGSTLDDFLQEEGVLAECEAIAIKEVIAWQIVKAMADKKLSKNKMAQLMHTSRAQLDRLLDPRTGNVTLETLQRAASVLGRSIRLELV